MPNRRALLSDLFWSSVAIGIVAVGVATYYMLGALQTPPEATEVERATPSVTVERIAPFEGPVPIVADGFLRAVEEVELAAEITARVTELHPAMRDRGRVSVGTVLLRLDARDAEAEVERAEADLATARSKRRLADAQLRRERTLRERGAISAEALDRRESEVEERRAALDAAEASLASAERQLDATVIRAPFDGHLRDVAVEIGTLLSPGTPVATLFSADRLEATVALQERAAALIPNLFDRPDAAATVTVPFGERRYRYRAIVHRVARTLAARTRTLDVTVRLDARSGRAVGDDAQASTETVPPALVNAYASVSIEGLLPGTVYALPAFSVRPDDTVWLVVDDALSIRPVRVHHLEADRRYVSLRAVNEAPGDTLSVVTSVLNAPVDGMPLAIVADDETAPRADERASVGERSGDGRAGNREP